MSPYGFLVDTYATERIKTLSVWSHFTDADLAFRPERRARTPQEQMVHQCVSEDTWMRQMLGIDVGLPPLPEREERLRFLERLLGRSLYSTYGPTADTGGLFQQNAPVIYRYDSIEMLLAAERAGDAKTPALPGPGAVSPTERPG